MASVRKIENKNGVSYQITVFSGRAGEKQVRHYKTYKPSSGMTQRQIEKELNRISVEFEDSIKQGYMLDNHHTFSEYAEYVL